VFNQQHIGPIYVGLSKEIQAIDLVLSLPPKKIILKEKKRKAGEFC
jgi:hypothetical protein